MFPVSGASLFCMEKPGFQATAAIKQQQGLAILAKRAMVYYYHSSCLGLPVVIVDCQVEGFIYHLKHVWQGGYAAMHEINIYGAEQKVCCDFFDELWMGGNPDKLNKVGHSTVYRTD